MRSRTAGFKNAIKTMGKEVVSQVIYGGTTLDNDDLIFLRINTNVNLFRTIMGCVEFSSTTKVVKGTTVNVKFGLKVGVSNELLDYGYYYIKDEPEYNADTKTYSHKAYSKMIESMVDYDTNSLGLIYPISLGELLEAICTKLGWTFTQTGYTNEDSLITSDIYLGLRWTYRDILDDLSVATMGNVVVSDNGVLSIKYPTETSDTIDAEFLKDVNAEFGDKFGPTNSLVLSRAEDGDLIYRNDEASISANGLNEIKIKDNLLLSSEDRENFIDDMFTKISGFEYSVIDVQSTGVAYYEALDRFTISVDGVSYSTILLNDEIIIEDGLVENIYTPKLDESTTDYERASLTDKGTKNALILAYKNKGEIRLLASEVESLSEFIETETTTGNYVKLTGTPVSNGAISQLSIKGFVLLPLYPGMAYPNQYTFPGALSFYTLVFDSVSTFDATPSYVYINSPIPLQKITTTYDEISIVGNKASIIQRIGYSGTTPIVLGTPIVHDVGSILLPTFDGDTYIKVLGFSSLIFSSTYMQKNALTNVFASQLESSAILSITSDAINTKVSDNEFNSTVTQLANGINSKVSKGEIVSEINQSAEEIGISAEKISLEGYTTINDGFSVDLNGNATMNNATINGSTLKLADNTEIVGGNGILANLQYISMTKQLGLINDNNSGVSLAKGVIDIEAYIPPNFTIKSAFLILRAYKTRNYYILPETFNSTDEYGKITNIRVYKVATNYEYIYSDQGFWGIDTDNPPALTEIPNALATGGYTNPTTAEVIITSIDISSYLSIGQNTLWIQTADSVPSPYNDANVTIASQKTQSTVVILNVIGYNK